MGNKVLDCTALTLTIIGAINWGLIGFFRFDLVAFIFGNMSWFSRIIYALVGLGGHVWFMHLWDCVDCICWRFTNIVGMMHK